MAAESKSTEMFYPPSGQPIPKEERYDWKPLTEKPELRWIDKNLIHVDHTYQRGLTPKAVRIAAKFSWPGFAAIVVVIRPDGSYACPDGQHRLEAAKKRTDITEVPCVVFKAEQLEEEARIFLLTNCERKPLSAHEKYRAKVQTGDDHTLLVDRLVKSVGREVDKGKGATSVPCIATLESCAKADAERLERLWPLLVQMHEGRAFSQVMVSTLFWIEGKLKTDTLTSHRWRERCAAVGYETLTQEALRASHFRGKGGARVWAEGMLTALNKGLRKKLELREPKKPAVEEGVQ